MHFSFIKYNLIGYNRKELNPPLKTPILLESDENSINAIH